MNEEKRYCEQCGKEMERTAQCEFHCKHCDITVFDFNLSLPKKKVKEFRSMAHLYAFCRGEDLDD